MPSLAVRRRPLKSPRDSSGTAEATIAASAASISTVLTPYTIRTVNRIHTRSSESTTTRAGSRAAMARCDQISSGRLRNLSAIVPMTGPNSIGAHTQNVVRAARLSDPVSALAHTPAARAIAELPKLEITTPLK